MKKLGNARRHAAFFVLAVIAAAASAAEDLERHRAPFRGQLIDYYVRDGLAIAEGDIILGTAAEMAAAREASERGVAMKGLTTSDPQRLWPIGASGAHEVPYVVVAGSQAAIDQAVVSFNALFPGVIQWVPRTKELDYVAFNLADQSTNSCSSNLGRVGGMQQIIGFSTCPTGLLMHEMGHAVGLWHVQEDPAQGQFLAIRYDTMDPRWRAQYTPRIDSRTMDGYDYGSIMHYGPYVQSVTTDDLTAGTLPAGIDNGQRTTYSAADIDAVVRLYGAPSSSVTVATNPPGLDVLVDGARVTTPATFAWKLGSLHRLDVPAGLQTKSGYSFGFGRWSHDGSAAPRSSQEWIVQPGNGELGAPQASPQTGVLTANFVRLVQVSHPVSNPGLGTFSKTAERDPWPGTTDLYAQGTLFALTGTPNAGNLSAPVNSGGMFAITGLAGPGGVAGGTWRLLASSPFASLGWSFGSGGALLLAAGGNGFDNERIVASVATPGATATGRLIPTIVQSQSGGNATVSPSDTWTRSDSVQFALAGVTGLDDPVTGRVAVPLPSQPSRTVTMLYTKQYKPVLTRMPSCGGNVALSNGATWLDHNTVVTATATPTTGAVFAGWDGTLSGSNPSQSFTVDKVPEPTAYFNTIPERVTIASVAPTTYTRGQGPVTFTITGTGFTSNMRVLVNGANAVTATQLVDAHTLKVTLSDAQFTRAGRAALRVGSFINSICVADSDDTIVVVRPAVTPQQITVFEFYNATLDRYFRTAVAEEAAALRANPATGEQDTGQTFKAWTGTAFPDGAKLVYRFYGSVTPGPNSHFFTSDEDEARTLQRLQLDTPATLKRWNYEEIAFAIKVPVDGACPADAPVKVYRVYNNGFALGKDSNHRLIVDLAIYNDMIMRGWLPEGVVMCTV
jgi:hypothetical protein